MTVVAAEIAPGSKRFFFLRPTEDSGEKPEKMSGFEKRKGRPREKSPRRPFPFGNPKSRRPFGLVFME